MKLTDFGWNDRLEAIFNTHLQKRSTPGRVVRVDRGAVTVQCDEGTLAAVVAGRLDSAGETDQPAVGDWVALDLDADTVVVRAVLPRIGALSRRRPGAADHAQAVAANVDVVFVVESVERGPNPRRIERAVALAWDGGATPVVVVTKTDLCDDVPAVLARAREGAPYCDVVPLSAVTGDGVDELLGFMNRGVTAVLLGPSGVGKSTLTNRLLGEERLAVSHVRSGDAKGRHTTTHRELVALPGGSCLIDTPGVRELGLWLGSDAVESAFPDIDEAAADCRFRDCRHESEPGCAVIEAVATGVIDQRRLDSYHRLRREAEDLDLRLDASRKHELRARNRSFGKMVKEAKRIKGG
ncbi:MAG: ribosome small subunit-dependent GTPase A [Thermoanaerobaculales bacterium]|nr:ribosome small subunit-dependent GTPase A [Thermoanaerobaculales bacterium]